MPSSGWSVLSMFGCMLAIMYPASPLLGDDTITPNLVVIMADDMGYRDASCYGCVDFQTPELDRLAAAGIRLTQGYVSHPYCSPSRAGLLTGRYQQSFGHEHNPPYREDSDRIGIDVGTELLPGILQDHGYATGLVGKWHLGAGPPFRPAVRGLGSFYGFLGGGHDYFQAKAVPQEYQGLLWRDDQQVSDSIEYLTDDLTREAQSFIQRNQNQPFCLLVMYNAPHAPDQVSDRYLKQVADIPHPGRRKYAGLVKGVDAGVGQIRRTLEQLKLTERTIVVFLSDNGGRRAVSDNRPLRGGKGWLHEGGVRVPFIVSWPGQLPESQTDDRPVSALDILPTALAAAEIPIPPGVTGVNLLPYLKREKLEAPHPTLFWRVCGGKGFAIRHEDWKLVHDVGMIQGRLYNLKMDPGEDQDLRDRFPEKYDALKSRYDEWSSGLEVPRWTEAHQKNTTSERQAARQAGTRQFPMPWVDQSGN